MTDQENNKNEFDGVLVVDFQIVVSHVCHSWRRIALKMARHNSLPQQFRNLATQYITYPQQT